MRMRQDVLLMVYVFLGQLTVLSFLFLSIGVSYGQFRHVSIRFSVVIRKSLWTSGEGYKGDLHPLDYGNILAPSLVPVPSISIINFKFYPLKNICPPFE